MFARFYKMFFWISLSWLNIMNPVDNKYYLSEFLPFRRECGLERFVPTGLLSSMKRKEVRKILSHHVKQCQLLEPGQKLLSPLQAKLHYMKLVSELRSFGGRCFMATMLVNRGEILGRGSEESVEGSRGSGVNWSWKIITRKFVFGIRCFIPLLFIGL